MSLEQDYLDRWLRLDVEGYFKGHEPRLIELARAPLLEKWRVNLACECKETPLRFCSTTQCRSPTMSPPTRTAPTVN